VVVEVAHRDDVADRTVLDEQRRHAPCGRPPAVLVDGELESSPLRLAGELARRLHIERERLLRQDMLPGLEGAADELRAGGRMRRDVDDLDLRVGEELVERRKHPLDPELLLDPRRRLRSQVEDADDALVVPAIRREVAQPNDAAAPDDADPGPPALGEDRAVLELVDHVGLDHAAEPACAVHREVPL
jgi:hypothetical protein